MPLIKNISSRKILFTIALLCILSIAYAYYAQFHRGYQPCPLCIAERVILATTGLLALIYAIHNPLGWMRRVYGIILISIAIFGIKVAAHHQWLINLPEDQQPLSCGMPLAVLYDRVPLHSFLHTVLQGDAECSKVNWLILGMTGPTAVIVLCSLIIVLALIITSRDLKMR